MTPHFWLRKLGDWIVTPLLSPMEGLRKEDQIYREVSSDLDVLSLKFCGISGWDVTVELEGSQCCKYDLGAVSVCGW